MPEIADLPRWFVQQLNEALADSKLISPRFYNSFAYTTTGQNLCHPRTLGLLVRICWSLPDVAAVDVDVHYNLGSGVKFQPDVVAVGQGGVPLLIIDFESPNSSDDRVPSKDVDAYLQWSKKKNITPRYFILTSLPRVVPSEPPRTRTSSGPKRTFLKRPPSWELRYYSPGWTNESHVDCKEDILNSPFKHWCESCLASRSYRDQMFRLMEQQPASRGLPISFVNLDGARAELIDLGLRVGQMG